MAGGRSGGGEGKLFEVFELGPFHAEGAPSNRHENRDGGDEGHQREKRGGIFEEEAAEHGEEVASSE
jgi:hypothetical protein